MNANIYHTKDYNILSCFWGEKTKPNKANVANNQSSLIDNQLRRQTQNKLVLGVCFLALELTPEKHPFAYNRGPGIYPRMSQSGTQFLYSSLIMSFPGIKRPDIRTFWPLSFSRIWEKIFAILFDVCLRPGYTPAFLCFQY